jgi:hypothetical protein
MAMLFMCSVNCFTCCESYDDLCLKNCCECCENVYICYNFTFVHMW